MAAPVTEKFEELILEVETAPLSGVYTKLCGLIDVTITRTAQIDTMEVVTQVKNLFHTKPLVYNLL